MEEIETKLIKISRYLTYVNYVFFASWIIFEFSRKEELLNKSHTLFFFIAAGLSLLIVFFRKPISKFIRIKSIYIGFAGYFFFSIISYALILISFVKEY
jgi:hypothetical protein